MEIIVLGTHRSGSSLVTRLINMMGAYFDVSTSSIGFTSETLQGFWERRDVMECNDAILAQFDSNWEQLSAWKTERTPSKKSFEKTSEISQKIREIVQQLSSNSAWVLKDPRLCLTLPYWKPHLTQPIAVVVTRDPLEVALSLKARYDFPLHHGVAMWEYYTANMINAMRDMKVIHLSHRALLANPMLAVEELLSSLKKAGAEGLVMPSEAEISLFVNPALQQSKAENLPPAQALTPFQMALHEVAEGRKPIPEGLLLPSELARQIMLHRKELVDRETKLLEANRSVAGSQQRIHELDSGLQYLQEHVRELETRLLRYSAGGDMPSITLLDNSVHKEKKSGAFSRMFGAFGSKKAA